LVGGLVCGGFIVAVVAFGRGFVWDGWIVIIAYDFVVAFGGGAVSVVELVGGRVCREFVVTVVAFGRGFVWDGWIVIVGFDVGLAFGGIVFSVAFGGGFVG
jgi:hypothetical protein